MIALSFFWHVCAGENPKSLQCFCPAQWQLLGLRQPCAASDGENFNESDLDDTPVASEDLPEGPQIDAIGVH